MENFRDLFLVFLKVKTHKTSILVYRKITGCVRIIEKLGELPKNFVKLQRQDTLERGQKNLFNENVKNLN